MFRWMMLLVITLFLTVFAWILREHGRYQVSGAGAVAILLDTENGRTWMAIGPGQKWIPMPNDDVSVVD